MTTEVNVSRQTVLVAEREFDISDLTSGTAVPMIHVKPNTRILRGYLEITTAFNTGAVGETPGEDTIDVGDTLTPDTDRYTATPIDVTSTGITALTAPITNSIISTPEAITILWTGTGGDAATTGAGRLYIEYIESDIRSTEFNTRR